MFEPRSVRRRLGAAALGVALVGGVARAGIGDTSFNVNPLNPQSPTECWTFRDDGTICVADTTTLGAADVEWIVVRLNPTTGFFMLMSGGQQIGSGIVMFDLVLEGNAGPNSTYFRAFATDACPCTGCTGMFVEGCSLGCGSGLGDLTCAGGVVAGNQELAVDFTQDVDLASVSAATFSILDVGTGTPAQGSFLADPSDASRLIFRPSLGLDAQGALVTGLQAGATYEVVVAGECEGAGATIVGAGGDANELPLRCTVTVEGLLDVVPGAPTVDVLVDVQLFDSMGNPTTLQTDVQANGAVDVSSTSTVRFLFDDVMNPATLVAPDGSSPGVEVLLDDDGDPATQADQSPLPGSFALMLDPRNGVTRLVFTPDCIPSSGSFGRRVVVRLLPLVADLVGNPLVDPGPIAFAGEGVAGMRVTLVEDFSTQARLDPARSGAEMWSGDGRVRPGFGGGSGRHGALVVRAGETVVLDTDETTFPLEGREHDVMSNLVPGVDYDPLDRSSWPTSTVTDGAFELADLSVEAGGTVVLHGDAPAVVLGRGNVDVEGDVDASGETGPIHLGWTPQTPATRGGPNAGAGGAGGTRYNATNFLSGGAIQGPARPVNLTCDQPNDTMCPPGTTIPITGNNCCLDIEEAMDGRAGGLVGQGATPPLAGSPAGSNGDGGVHWPPIFPISGSGSGWRDLVVDDSGPGAACRSLQVGGPGGGGGYVEDGGPGIAVTLPEASGAFNPLNLPPGDTPGGTTIVFEPANPATQHFLRKLDPRRGFLRGGSGGGGGGTNLFWTGTQVPFSVLPCNFQNIWEYYDNSGAPGGGGGGGLSLTSGATLTLDGRVLARGGDGGSASSTPPSRTNGTDRRNVTPGGGGSGGSLRLQAFDMAIADLPGRVDVRGGVGGVGVAGSTGGDGSRGLVRLEQPREAQRDPARQITRMSERAKVEPFDASAPQDSDLHLSVGRWATPRGRPDSFSGVTSCWLQADGAGCQLRLTFADDDFGLPGDPSDDVYGWNLVLVYDDGSGERLFPFRGVPNDPQFPLLDSFETTLGNLLGSELPVGQGSPLVVRFQGARSVEPVVVDPCDVALDGPDAEIVPGSLTPWVSHPAQLNGFSPAPNMIRFTILFDGSVAFPGTVAAFVKGVWSLRIEATPE